MSTKRSGTAERPRSRPEAEALEVSVRTIYRDVEALGGAGVPIAKGWRETTLRLEPIPIAVHQLLPLGSALEVLDPPELRRAMAEEAGRLVERYAVA